MSERQVIRVWDVMKGNFDMVDGMSTVAEALDTMIHVETKTLPLIEDTLGILGTPR